jgi:exonuclease VII small subunit
MKTFNQNITRLEEITTMLENGDCELEKAMELYTEGVEIINSCTKTLNEAKLKVTENDIK